jgi:uncharacterized membrane protein YbaN (DUF454 family)
LNPWLILGVLFLLIGAVGVVLPLLPTTPFVLAAAACFAKSSPRMHTWLLGSRVFGPVISNWENKKCIPLRAKLLALTMMTAVGGTSVLFFVPPGWPRLAGAGLIVLGCLVVLPLKVCPGTDDQSH